MADKKVTAADTTADPKLQEMTAAEMRMVNEANADKAAKKQMEAASRKPKLGFKKGGKVSSASGRADGIASRGKTRGTIVRMG